MKIFLRYLPLLFLSLFLAGCSTVPEYPGSKDSVAHKSAKTNGINSINQLDARASKAADKTAAPSHNMRPPEPASGLGTICVGAWCSCDSGEGGD